MNIEFVLWRDGRPRFSPSPSLRKLGHAGHDLKLQDAGGAMRWMTPGEALDWSRAFKARIEGDRQAARSAKVKAREKIERDARRAVRDAGRIAKEKSYTLGQLLEDHLVNGIKSAAPATRRLYTECKKMIELEAPLAFVSEATAISRKAVIGIYEDLLEKRGVSMSYTGIRYLCLVYNWAIDRERIEGANPAARIRMTAPGMRIRTITPAELLHLVATADRLELGDVGDAILWGVFGCQRCTDRLDMRPDQIIDGRMELTQKKTGKDVSVRLAKPILARLKLRPIGNKPRILVHETTGLAMPYPTYYGRYIRVRDEAAKTLPKLKGFRDQDLRDTAISWMGKSGCTDFEVMAVSGHTHSKETKVLGHYMSIDHEFADAAIKKLDRWFAAEVKKLNLKGEGK